MKTKECVKQAVTRPWIDVGIPQNATSLGESYVGSAAVPGANLLVTIWRNEFTDQKNDKFVYLGTWTYEYVIHRIHFENPEIFKYLALN